MYGTDKHKSSSAFVFCFIAHVKEPLGAFNQSSNTSTDKKIAQRKHKKSKQLSFHLFNPFRLKNLCKLVCFLILRSLSVDQKNNYKLNPIRNKHL
jgi:hypothetical protein